ncbi:MAG: MFS transporter [Chloroflexi bacterium]|nr:MFS transporter [Chloroflexota bacterium]
MPRPSASQRWHLLALAAATHTFAAAIPFSSMPVLFKEISEDLGLNLVQVGAVWGSVNLAGVFVALIAGLLGDRFGVRAVLGMACLLGGVTGGLRGLSGDFVSLALTVFAFGLVRSMIPINVHKGVGIWFRGHNLGLANGIVSMGMGLGLMVGPLISATIMSPWVGGWRNVLALYGAVSVGIGMLWFLFGQESVPPKPGYVSPVPLRQALPTLLRIRGLWLMGLTLLFRMGSIMGMVGYLPLFLRGQGWAPADADGMLAGFFAASILAVLPLSVLSDRIGLRKPVLFAGLAAATIGLGLLPLADGIMVWIVMVLVGVFMDGFMAVSITMVQETAGVRATHSGAALGVVFTISLLGASLSPPSGNSLASISAGLPFLFWAGLSVLAAVTLAFARETGHPASKTVDLRHPKN